MKLLSLTVGKRSLTLASVAALALLSGSLAHADQLQDIKSRGKLVCGTLGTSEPFSFQDPSTREIIGYDVDMCKAVARDLGVKLELMMVSVDARIPSLQQGRVDILAANLGYTKARAEQIAYSNSYFVSQQKLIARADAGITTIEQLKGKRISAIKGSSSEQGVRREIPDAETATFGETSTAFLAVAQGKAAAFCASELILVKLKEQSAKTTPLHIIEKPLFSEAWGLGVRKDETAFLNEVNKSLTKMESSGEIDTTYGKWFGPNSFYKMKREFKVEPIKS
jgi:polar amino acid transport system substrate-binding protein